MNKKSLFVILIVCIAALSFAGEKASREFSEVTGKVRLIMDNYYNSLRGVNNAGDYARVINNYTDEMLKVAPKLKAIEQKYGRQGEDRDARALAAFREYQADIEKAFSDERIQKTVDAFNRYNSDPRVQEALDRLNRLMAEALGYEG